MLVLNVNFIGHLVGYKAGTRKGGCSGKEGFPFFLPEGRYPDLKTGLTKCLIDTKCKGVWDRGVGKVYSCMKMEEGKDDPWLHQGQKYAKGEWKYIFDMIWL